MKHRIVHVVEFVLYYVVISIPNSLHIYSDICNEKDIWE